MKSIKFKYMNLLAIVVLVSGLFVVGLGQAAKAKADDIIRTPGASIEVEAQANVKADVDKDNERGEADSNNRRVLEEKTERQAPSATSSAAREKEDDERDQDGDKDKGQRGRGDEHKSAVATFVRGLLEIASSSPAIGAEVSAVAKEQEDDKDKTAEAAEKVEGRSAFIKLLIGADFKNLGQLRSSIAAEENAIKRLSNLKGQVSADVQVKLDAEVKALSDDKARLEAVVKANENVNGLFGWLVKLLQ